MKNLSEKKRAVHEGVNRVKTNDCRPLGFRKMGSHDNLVSWPLTLPHS